MTLLLPLLLLLLLLLCGVWVGMGGEKTLVRRLK